jgi:hypothetical protein
MKLIKVYIQMIKSIFIDGVAHFLQITKVFAKQNHAVDDFSRQQDCVRLQFLWNETQRIVMSFSVFRTKAFGVPRVRIATITAATSSYTTIKSKLDQQQCQRMLSSFSKTIAPALPER